VAINNKTKYTATNKANTTNKPKPKNAEMQQYQNQIKLNKIK